MMMMRGRGLDFFFFFEMISSRKQKVECERKKNSKIDFVPDD